MELFDSELAESNIVRKRSEVHNSGVKEILLCAHKKLVDEGTERIFKRVVKHDGSIIKKD